MKQVSLASIEKAIEKIDNLDEDGLERVAETFALAHPVLLGYAMSASEEYENDNLQGLLIYYFCLLVESFNNEGASFNEITEAVIEEFEEPFFDVLDSFFETENLEDLEEYTDQPDLVKFMMAEISTPDVDGTELDDETATQLFIVATAIIALLSKSIKA
ncbi:MAG TPA: hypothetical protein VKZ44_03580 [Taishania sp.]|nr:hypothetical protein [Taishania sp.]